MDIGVLVGFVACAVVLALAMDLSGATVRTVGGMFHAPDLGWPSGVQEDDDMHWSWAARKRGDRTGDRTEYRTGDRIDDRAARQRIAGPELEEIDSGSVRLLLQPIRRGPH